VRVSPRWLCGFALGWVFVLCAVPVAVMILPLLFSPTQTISEIGALLGSGRLWGLWERTCGLAMLTAVLATLIGGPLGVLLDQPAFRHRGWIRLLLTMPLLLPPHVLAVAWVDLLGQQGLINSLAARAGLPPHPFPLYSVAGVALVEALSLFPIPLWCAWNAARQIDPALPEAARNLGASPLVRLRLLLPLFIPALLGGALLVFVLALMSFSIPSLLQTQVFTVEIFTSFNSFLDQRQAALTALPLCLTGIAVLILAVRVHGPTINAARQCRAIQASGKTHCGVGVAMALVVIAAIGLPVSALAWRSLPLGSLWSAWQTGGQEIGTSLVLSLLSATLMLTLAFPLAWGTRGRGRAILFPAALAWLVSGPVFGVGLIQFWNHPGVPGWIYDRFAILVLAAVGRNFLFAWLGCRLALAWLPRDTVEAARNLGANSRLTLAAVALPALRRPLFAVWACLALLVMGEVECTVLVAPPGWVPVSLRIFTLMHYGPSATVSSLALLQAASTAALLLTAGFFAGSRSLHAQEKPVL
jgi:iron(III) transport system permease protein